ncbi:MAG: hypothetical protein JWM32_1247 [Verrucomicrobia bacterium]|nr:hypothetical protein [Verrucomicrobiota bacterium]
MTKEASQRKKVSAFGRNDFLIRRSPVYHPMFADLAERCVGSGTVVYLIRGLVGWRGVFGCRWQFAPLLWKEKRVEQAARSNTTARRGLSLTFGRRKMNAALPSFALLFAIVTGCSSAPRIVTDAGHIPQGRYIPHFGKIVYAGAYIEVRGTEFTYEWFTDALPEMPTPPVTGTIRKEGDLFVFERAGSPWMSWRLGSVHGRSVLWPEESYAEWKSTKSRKSLDDILSLEEKSNQPPHPMAPTHRG